MFGGSSKRAALKEAHRLEDEAHALNVPACDETVVGFLTTWLNIHKTKVAARTIERYGELVRLVVPHVDRVRLNDLRSLDLEQVYARLLTNGGKGGRPLSTRTVHHVHAALRKAFGDAVRWGRLSRAPTDGCSPPKIDRTAPTVSTAADLATLLKAFVDPDLATIVEVIALTGMRRQEILALEWGDIDFAGARLIVSKAVEESRTRLRVKETKSAAGARTVHLPQRAIAALATHRKRQLELRLKLGADWHCGELVFPSYVTGGVRRPRNVTKAVHRARRRAGIKGGTIHGFRHGHATELLRAGVAPKVIQERLGHASIVVTMDTYASVLPAMDRAAAAAIETVFVDQNVDQAEKPKAN
jgi:integrase